MSRAIDASKGFWGLLVAIAILNSRAGDQDTMSGDIQINEVLKHCR